MSPALKIMKWSYTDTVITSADHVYGEPHPVAESARRTEKVSAMFQIIDGEPFKATSRAIPMQPEYLSMTFKASNGGKWRDSYSTRVLGRNVTKNGLGAHTEATWAIPGALLALFEPDGEGRSDALDWVRAEYPR